MSLRYAYQTLRTLGRELDDLDTDMGSLRFCLQVTDKPHITGEVMTPEKRQEQLIWAVRNVLKTYYGKQ